MNSSIFTYRNLIASFIEKKLTAVQFEAEYLDLFKYDESRTEEMYEILNPLFWAVEDFCPDPELREEGDLDENQLSEAAKVTLKKLDELNEIANPENGIDTEELAVVLRKLLQEMLPDMLKEALKEVMPEAPDRKMAGGFQKLPVFKE